VIARLDRIIAKLAQKDETARRQMCIPGFGPIIASAMAASVQDASSFAVPREFAAFLGLTPKQNSSGGKPKLGRISKMGQSLSAKIACRGRACCAVLPQAAHRSTADVGEEADREEALQACRRGARQQDARIAFAILRGKTVYREIPP
jgi:transposase